MFNKLRPTHNTGKEVIPLSEEHFEPAQTYLGRERRIAWLRGPIAGAPHRWDTFSPNAMHDNILAWNWEDPDTPIYLLIDSPGGLLGDGLILYDTIKLSVAPVITICQQAASMATVLAAAGSTRLVYPHSRIMLHLPQGGVPGDVKDVELASKEMKKVSDMMADMYIECGVKKEKASLLVDIDRQFWMGAEEAIEYGLADRIITPQELMLGKA